MRHTRIIFTQCSFLLCAALLVTSCHHRWSEREKDEFRKRCAQSRTFSGMVIQLTGFEFEEVDDILVRDLVRGKVTGTFRMRADKTTLDPLRKRYTASLSRSMHVDHAYEFIVARQRPYLLHQMKMVMWPQFTMTSEGWGCVMGDYVLDGRHFEHNANPDIVKRR